MSENGAKKRCASGSIRAMDFRIKGLSPQPFAHLFAMDDDELARHWAVKRVADSKPGFPCRVMLEDAEPGATVLLVNYEHLPVDSPYRASHAIYVSGWSGKAFDQVNVVPQALRDRLLSLRAFDAAGMMVDADITDGAKLEALIERLLAQPRVEYLHAHFARRGCYAARIERAITSSR